MSHFRPGDILLVDTSETALWETDEGSIVAISSIQTDHTGSGPPRKGRFRLIGFLQKQNADHGGISGFHFFLEVAGVVDGRRAPRAAFLGFSVGPKDSLHENLTVLGRVIAWISPNPDPRREQKRKK